jgi:hypothetical protein
MKKFTRNSPLAGRFFLEMYGERYLAAGYQAWMLDPAIEGGFVAGAFSPAFSTMASVMFGCDVEAFGRRSDDLFADR